jgi:hypothetical protein
MPVRVGLAFVATYRKGLPQCGQLSGIGSGVFLDPATCTILAVPDVWSRGCYAGNGR